jgi:DNA-binding GntR family transcriptional regulator
MLISPKTANETNREYALRVIRDNIINLEIKPGSLIGEQEIADKLGLSRTPVHEALLELSKSKIVDILPQKGCRVSMIDSTLIDEARFLRSTVESALVEMACTMAKEEDFRTLESNLKLQEFYLANSDPDKIFELDNEFHMTLYKICNKMQCYYMVRLMSLHFDRVRNMSLYSVKELKIVADHRALFEAIKSGDAASAHAALHKHLSRFDFDIQAIQEHYPEYFA